MSTASVVWGLMPAVSQWHSMKWLRAKCFRSNLYRFVWSTLTRLDIFLDAETYDNFVKNVREQVNKGIVDLQEPGVRYDELKNAIRFRDDMLASSTKGGRGGSTTAPAASSPGSLGGATPPTSAPKSAPAADVVFAEVDLLTWLRPALWPGDYPGTLEKDEDEKSLEAGVRRKVESRGRGWRITAPFRVVGRGLRWVFSPSERRRNKRETKALQTALGALNQLFPLDFFVDETDRRERVKAFLTHLAEHEGRLLPTSKEKQAEATGRGGGKNKNALPPSSKARATAKGKAPAGDGGKNKKSPAPPGAKDNRLNLDDAEQREGFAVLVTFRDIISYLGVEDVKNQPKPRSKVDDEQAAATSPVPPIAPCNDELFGKGADPPPQTCATRIVKHLRSRISGLASLTIDILVRAMKPLVPDMTKARALARNVLLPPAWKLEEERRKQEAKRKEKERDDGNGDD
eukprot:g6.t1